MSKTKLKNLKASIIAIIIIAAFLLSALGIYKSAPVSYAVDYTAATARSLGETFKANIAASDKIYDENTAAEKIYTLNEVYDLLYSGTTSSTIVDGIITTDDKGNQLLINKSVTVAAYNYCITISTPLELMRFSYLCAGYKESAIGSTLPAGQDNELINFFQGANIKLGGNIDFEQNTLNFYTNDYTGAATSKVTVSAESGTGEYKTTALSAVYGSTTVALPFLRIPLFGGSFDGQGFTITNLKILSNDAVDRTYTVDGIFGTVAAGANVENFGLIDAEFITGANAQGYTWQTDTTTASTGQAIIAVADSSATVKNIFALGTTALNNFEGIVAVGTGTDCYSYATTVSGTNADATAAQIAAISSDGWYTSGTDITLRYLQKFNTNGAAVKVRAGLKYQSANTYSINAPADLMAFSAASFENTLPTNVTINGAIDMRYVGSYSYIPALTQSTTFRSFSGVEVSGQRGAIYNFNISAYLHGKGLLGGNPIEVYAAGLLTHMFGQVISLGTNNAFTFENFDIINGNVFIDSMADTSQVSTSAATLLMPFVNYPTNVNNVRLNGKVSSADFHISASGITNTGGNYDNISLGGMYGHVASAVNHSYTSVAIEADIIGSRVNMYKNSAYYSSTSAYNVGGLYASCYAPGTTEYATAINVYVGGTLVGFNINERSKSSRYTNFNVNVGGITANGFIGSSAKTLNGIYVAADLKTINAPWGENTNYTLTSELGYRVGGILAYMGRGHVTTITPTKVKFGGTILADGRFTADGYTFLDMNIAAGGLVGIGGLSIKGKIDSYIYTSDLVGSSDHIAGATAAPFIFNEVAPNIHTQIAAGSIKNYHFSIGNLLGNWAMGSTFEYVINDVQMHANALGARDTGGEFRTGLSLGGFAGRYSGGNTNGFTFCSNIADITATAYYSLTNTNAYSADIQVAGLFAGNAGNVKFFDCTNSGKIRVDGVKSTSTANAKLDKITFARVTVSGLSYNGLHTRSTNTGEVSINLSIKDGQGSAGGRLAKEVNLNYVYVSGISRSGSNNIGCKNQGEIALNLGDIADTFNANVVGVNGIGYGESGVPFTSCTNTGKIKVTMPDDNDITYNLGNYSVNGIAYHGTIDKAVSSGEIGIYGKSTASSSITNEWSFANATVNNKFATMNGISQHGIITNATSTASIYVGFNDPALNSTKAYASNLTLDMSGISYRASIDNSTATPKFNINNVKIASVAGLGGANFFVKNSTLYADATFEFGGTIEMIYVGGISARSNGETYNCKVLAGTKNSIDIDLANVSNLTTLRVGGIAAMVYSYYLESESTYSLSDCVNTVDIIVTNVNASWVASVGGIAGSGASNNEYVQDAYNQPTNKIINCVNSGNITLSDSITAAPSSALAYMYSVGGIVGSSGAINDKKALNNPFINIESCYNYGEIKSVRNSAAPTASIAAAGGIMGGYVGYGTSDRFLLRIASSNSIGSVSALSQAGGLMPNAFAGGIIGGISSSGCAYDSYSVNIGATIYNTIFGSTVYGSTVKGYNAGGIVGDIYARVASRYIVMNSVLCYGTINGYNAGGAVGYVRAQSTGIVSISGGAVYTSVTVQGGYGGKLIGDSDSRAVTARDFAGYGAPTGTGTLNGLAGRATNITVKHSAYIYAQGDAVTTSGIASDADITVGTESAYADTNSTLHYTNEVEYYLNNNSVYGNGGQRDTTAATLVWSNAPYHKINGLTSTHCYAVTMTFGRAYGVYLGDSYSANAYSLLPESLHSTVIAALDDQKQITENRDSAIDPNYPYLVLADNDKQGALKRNLPTATVIKTTGITEATSNRLTVTFGRADTYYIQNYLDGAFSYNTANTVLGEGDRPLNVPYGTKYKLEVNQTPTPLIYYSAGSATPTPNGTLLATLTMYTWQGEQADFDTNSNLGVTEFNEWLQIYGNKYTIYIIYADTSATVELAGANGLSLSVRNSLASTAETTYNADSTLAVEDRSTTEATDTTDGTDTVNYTITTSDSVTHNVSWIKGVITADFVIENLSEAYLTSEPLPYSVKLQKANADGTAYSDYTPTDTRYNLSIKLDDFTASTTNIEGTDIPVTRISCHAKITLVVTDFTLSRGATVTAATAMFELEQGDYRIAFSVDAVGTDFFRYVNFTKEASGDFFMHYNDDAVSQNNTSFANTVVTTSTNSNNYIRRNYPLATVADPTTRDSLFGIATGTNFASESALVQNSSGNYSFNTFLYTMSINYYGAILSFADIIDGNGGITNPAAFMVNQSGTPIAKVGEYAQYKDVSYVITPDTVNKPDYTVDYTFTIVAQNGNTLKYSLRFVFKYLAYSVSVTQDNNPVSVNGEDCADIDRRGIADISVAYTPTKTMSVSFEATKLELYYELVEGADTQLAATYTVVGNAVTSVVREVDQDGNYIVANLPTVTALNTGATTEFNLHFPQNVDGGYYYLQATMNIMNVTFTAQNYSNYSFITALADENALSGVNLAASNPSLYEVKIIKNSGRSAYMHDISFEGTKPDGATLWGYVQTIGTGGTVTYTWTNIQDLTNTASAANIHDYTINYKDQFVEATDPKYFTSRTKKFRIQIRYASFASDYTSFLTVRYKAESAYTQGETVYNDEGTTLWRMVQNASGDYVVDSQIQGTKIYDEETGETLMYIDMKDILIPEGETVALRVVAENTKFYTDYEFITEGPLRNKTFNYIINGKYTDETNTEHDYTDSLITRGTMYFMLSSLIDNGIRQRSNTLLYTVASADQTITKTIVSSRNASGSYEIGVRNGTVGYNLSIVYAYCATDAGLSDIDKSLQEWNSSGFKISSDRAAVIDIYLHAEQSADIVWGDNIFG